MKNKIKKFLSCALAVSVIALSTVGCAEKKGDVSSISSVKAKKAEVNVAILKGPTAIGMLNLMSKNKKDDAENSYNFEIFTAADQIVPKIVNKTLDIAAIPTNLAANLYKKTNKNIKILAVNTLGVLSLVTNGENISSIADLKGKTIYSTGQGSTPEYALNFILKKNGLTVGKDVKVEYKSEHSELASLVISGAVKIAVLPQPFTTNVLIKNSNVKVALDLSDEWAKACKETGGELVMGCIIVRNDFIEKNKIAVDAFLSEYSDSTSKANSDISTTAKLSDEFDILASAVVEKAIPNCNIVCITGGKMKKSVSDYFDVLYKANPASIGGELPDESIYYEK